MHLHHAKSGEVSSKATQGYIINLGWRYDLILWWYNFQSRGKWQELLPRIADLAQFQPGETVLDVGCGTGTSTIIAKQDLPLLDLFTAPLNVTLEWGR